ncbi:ATP-binding protein [Streptomyces sp. Tue6028]|uniref:ATP-binding protein n=2 Tax=Streptomyces TaxID=1883 RepID=UPI003EBEA526
MRGAHPDATAPLRLVGHRTASRFPGPARMRVTDAQQGLVHVRDFTRRTLAAWESGACGDEAVLVVNELATNALLHAASKVPVERREVWLKLSLRRAHLVCAVTDPYDRPPVHLPADVAQDDHGRGLGIVDALSEHWGWTRFPAGKIVWAMLRTPCPPDGTEAWGPT